MTRGMVPATDATGGVTVMGWVVSENEETGGPAMTRPIAAELLLLALDEKSGKSLVDSTTLGAGLIGAAVVDLVLDGALELVQAEGGPVKRGRLARTGRNAPSGEPMSVILEKVHGKKPKTAVSELYAWTWKDHAGRLKQQLLEQMAAEGLLSREDRTVMGLFPSTRWKEADGRDEAEVRSRLRTVVVDGHDPDERTGALVSLVSALDLAPKLFPDADKKLVKARAEEVRKQQWAGQAVHDAVQELTAAMMVAVFVPIIVSGAS